MWCEVWCKVGCECGLRLSVVDGCVMKGCEVWCEGRVRCEGCGSSRGLGIC